MTEADCMPDDKCNELVRDLVAKTCAIELGDKFAHAIGNGTAYLSDLAHARTVDIYGRGLRTVDVIRNGKVVEMLTATREQARKLRAFGAKPFALDVEAEELEESVDPLPE
jgi:hypothetical protein